jgi:hypothetical protein
VGLQVAFGLMTTLHVGPFAPLPGGEWQAPPSAVWATLGNGTFQGRWGANAPPLPEDRVAGPEFNLPAGSRALTLRLAYSPAQGPVGASLVELDVETREGTAWRHVAHYQDSATAPDAHNVTVQGAATMRVVVAPSGVDPGGTYSGSWVVEGYRAS